MDNLFHFLASSAGFSGLGALLAWAGWTTAIGQTTFSVVAATILAGKMQSPTETG